MIDNEYYSQELHGPYQQYELGDFTLEEGGTIRGCKLAYATFGELSDTRDNAILVTTWLPAPRKSWNRYTSVAGR